MAAARKARSSLPNKWDPWKIDKKELHQVCRVIRENLNRMEREVHMGSVLCHIDYENVMEGVDKLYPLLDLGTLYVDLAEFKKAERKRINDHFGTDKH